MLLPIHKMLTDVMPPRLSVPDSQDTQSSYVPSKPVIWTNSEFPMALANSTMLLDSPSRETSRAK